VLPTTTTTTHSGTNSTTTTAPTYIHCSSGCTHRDTQLAEQRTKVLHPGTRGCMYGRVEQHAAQLVDGFQTDLPQYRTGQGDLQLRKHLRHLKVCMYVCMYACMLECMYVFMYVCMYDCMYVCMYECMNV
jgi:hypothetical protein